MARTKALISRFIVTAMTVAMLTPVASAQQPDATITRPRAKASPTKDAHKQKPVARSRTTNPCAAFGAGFVQMAGSDTCVRVGGAIDLGVGMSR